jgi:hypothetical protein
MVHIPLNLPNELVIVVVIAAVLMLVVVWWLSRWGRPAHTDRENGKAPAWLGWSSAEALCRDGNAPSSVKVSGQGDCPS